MCDVTIIAGSVSDKQEHSVLFLVSRVFCPILGVCLIYDVKTLAEFLILIVFCLA